MYVCVCVCVWVGDVLQIALVSDFVHIELLLIDLKILVKSHFQELFQQNQYLVKDLYIYKLLVKVIFLLHVSGKRKENTNYHVINANVQRVFV